ncbi:MAG TPA: maltose alpha-D-glucosyltransferase [Gemmatimonadales bacterium]|nr:maltose alpha-D-glucosyltransferase [Gemmatimonadales bacterium]
MSNAAQWYKDAVIYQLHVRAFADSDGDGIGDFPGLTSKLDYLQDLGVTALWLLPFYPSPLRDDGYDIADYGTVNPIYGTLGDFRSFLKEAHRRGLKVITELVMNHTSDQHPWFQKARSAKPGSRARDFYVWSDSPDRYLDARIIFKDFEPSNWTWDPVAQAYYWHRFYAHQPDLNFDNPAVRRAMVKALDFWLDMGVDGLRLDAVPYLYERDGTNCENLPETHAFLRELRRHVDNKYGDRMLLSEANQWPEDAVAYFGDDDETHMAFHFPVMPRLFMALHMEDRFPVVDIMQQTPSLPPSGQWAMFLRNHDELTLEMVSDEDRDYMYRAYAHDPRMRINLGIRRRLAPLLGNDRRRIELMNGLLFSLPGTPIIYYGDEIGMGDNIYLGDRNGVRTPMQWSADRNAGFSRANPQRLYSPVIIDPEYHFEAVNVEAQQNNPHSTLWWMKRLIALRKHLPGLGRGSIEFLQPENRKVLTFLRRYQHQVILVVVNLSRYAQCVELDLAEFKDLVPIEAFGRTPFPPIGELPYFLTLGPHAFYWFVIQPRAAVETREMPELACAGPWTDVFAQEAGIEDALLTYLPPRRWFAGKARELTGAVIEDRVTLPYDGDAAELALVRCTYREGEPETYVLPLAFATDERRLLIEQAFPWAVVARLTAGAPPTEGILFDATVDEPFVSALLASATSRRRLKGTHGTVHALRTRALARLRGADDATLTPALLRAEQSNTSITFGDRLILKLFRRVEAGVNPDVEIGRFLTERTDFPNAPRIGAAFEYRRPKVEPTTLGLIQEFVPNEGDAWRYTLDGLSQYFESVLTHAMRDTPPVNELASALALVGRTPPAPLDDLLGRHLQLTRLLGQRTGELHVALASDTANPAFAPEGFSALYQRATYQAARSLARRVLDALRKTLRTLPDTDRNAARELLRREPELLERLKAVTRRKLSGKRIRCHGDYHLGQVLFTGKDFVIIDFEGEPARPLSERRFKRSPLRDVAGMLRSFDYAAASALSIGHVRTEDAAVLAPWADLWVAWTEAAFLDAYLETTDAAGILPRRETDLALLLDVLLLEKAAYEVGYELAARPGWVHLPVRGILRLLDRGAPA